MKRLLPWGIVVTCGLIVLVVLLLLIPLALQPFGDRMNPGVQAVRSLALALYSYGLDHGGKYPEGKNSTEIFQKLIDEGYIYDGELLYLPMPGKAGALAGTLKANTARLRPENVCWDITYCGDSGSADHLPLVFLTGYKVIYQPGARALSLHEPSSQNRWALWWSGKKPSLPVGWMENGSCCGRSIDASPDGTIPNFIPADFDLKGKTYRQITPDGEFRP